MIDEQTVRFMMWSTSIAAGIVAAHFLIAEKEYRKFSFGLTGHFFVLSVHQFYWWLSSRAFQDGDMALHDAIYSHRYIATTCELLMIGFTLFILEPALRRWFGTWWYAGGGAIGIVLYVAGKLTLAAQ